MLTLTDLFCGAGGSSTGAVEVPGVRVRMAANHWDLAVETHNTNHPDADHACADISQVDPRLFPRTDLLWASPECTRHSGASGRKQLSDQLDLFAPAADEAAQRSRATMWDVVRFAEHHRYRSVVVENVVEVADWPPFRAWLLAMGSLGYAHQVVSLNSMHAQATGAPAPQSRDRLYVVFHRDGDRAPDVAGRQRPRAWCATCGEVVAAVQAFKRPDRPVGRYRAQYVYRCPRRSCRHQVVEPGWLPASTIIDWSLPGHRIGDRDRPLAAKTRARIAAGIARYWSDAEVGPVVPVKHRAGPLAASASASASAWSMLRAQPTRWETALVCPAGGTWNTTPTPVTDPLRTRTTRETDAVVMPAFLAELRGGGSTHRRASDPLCTVTAGGNHHGLVTSYYGHGTTTGPLSTVTTVDRHGLLTPGVNGPYQHGPDARGPAPSAEQVAAAQTRVDDARFRMLTPGEVTAAMAFPASYVVLGTRRQQVRMAGNAVTPPAARDLLAAVVDALGDAS